MARDFKKDYKGIELDFLEVPDRELKGISVGDTRRFIFGQGGALFKRVILRTPSRKGNVIGERTTVHYVGGDQRLVSYIIASIN